MDQATLLPRGNWYGTSDNKKLPRIRAELDQQRGVLLFASILVRMQSGGSLNRDVAGTHSVFRLAGHPANLDHKSGFIVGSHV